MSRHESTMELKQPDSRFPKMEIETRWFEDGLIEQRTVDLRGEIVMQFINTKEAHIRKALIALGWTPPKP